MTKFILKSTGIKERFNIQKFKRSLKKAGAPSRIITTIAHEVVRQPELTTTFEIYKYALGRLKQLHRPVAARYNLKAALYELGPSGYPFEYFIGHLFAAQGYAIRIGEIVRGKCVAHEIDVCAYKEGHHYMIECKFHNQMGIKSNVKVPLYVKARFDDLKQAWEKYEHERKKKSDAPKGIEDFHQAWVVTNTQFTSDALAYSNCVDIKALGWSYPKKGNLAQLIDRHGLHPITALTTLSKRQKRDFIEQGLVLCRDVAKQRNLLKKLGIDELKIEKIIEEAIGVCKIT
ncbi:MAG: hypothetical protein WD068_01420 [Candidatus Babeliales bacterium]